jgi:hypothetical protein
MVTIMSSDACSKEYRAVTAEMLAQICARSRADQDRNRLSSVANALSTVRAHKLLLFSQNNIVLQCECAIIYAKIHVHHYCWLSVAAGASSDSNRKLFASFLGLAVQIHAKLATAEAFANAVTGLPMGNNIFAEKLKRIIKMTIDTECESHVFKTVVIIILY